MFPKICHILGIMLGAGNTTVKNMVSLILKRSYSRKKIEMYYVFTYGKKIYNKDVNKVLQLYKEMID